MIGENEQKQELEAIVVDATFTLGAMKLSKWTQTKVHSKFLDFIQFLLLHKRRNLELRVLKLLYFWKKWKTQ